MRPAETGSRTTRGIRIETSVEIPQNGRADTCSTRSAQRPAHSSVGSSGSAGSPVSGLMAWQPRYSMAPGGRGGVARPSSRRRASRSASRCSGASSRRSARLRDTHLGRGARRTARAFVARRPRGARRVTAAGGAAREGARGGDRREDHRGGYGRVARRAAARHDGRQRDREQQAPHGSSMRTAARSDNAIADTLRSWRTGPDAAIVRPCGRAPCTQVVALAVLHAGCASIQHATPPVLGPESSGQATPVGSRGRSSSSPPAQMRASRRDRTCRGVSGGPTGTPE